jgi:dihydrofolate reductase
MGEDVPGVRDEFRRSARSTHLKMRKFKLQVQTSVDGYMGGPNGEMAWVTVPWTDDASAYSDALHKPVDLIVLGRKLAEDLLDELHLFVNPVGIGAGLPLFPNLDANKQLRQVNVQAFECGITAFHLEPKRS